MFQSGSFTLPVWNVESGGSVHKVEMVSPRFGQKSILVDNKEVVRVGSTTTMWSNHKLRIGDEQIEIRFRAIRSRTGISLYLNGKFVVPSENTGEDTAEAVTTSMVIQVALIGVTVLFMIFA